MASRIAVALIVSVLVLAVGKQATAEMPGRPTTTLPPLSSGELVTARTRILCDRNNSAQARQHPGTGKSGSVDGTAEAVVSWLTTFFEPWQKFYRKIRPLSTALVAAHLLALLFGGGLAIAADRVVLRAPVGEPEARRRTLEGLQAAHRPVLVALVVLFVTGIALAAADIKAFATSPVFAIKLLFVGILLGNGLALMSTERALRALGEHTTSAPRLWRRLRTTAWASTILWATTVLMGTVLVDMG